jgi:glycogen operon protein
LFARHAKAVTLVVEYTTSTDAKARTQHFRLDPEENRTGDMWHILIRPSSRTFTYGYSIIQEDDTVQDTGSILIDPYAQTLLPRKWGEAAAYGERPSCKIEKDTFDWQNDLPLKTPLSDTIIYELHLRGFTRHKSTGVNAPGTYLGLIEKIPYLKELGVTAVELMPITEFDENDNIFKNPETGESLKNYWGYNPVSFFRHQFRLCQRTRASPDRIQDTRTRTA